MGQRVILAFDPLALRNPEAVVSECFVHRLSTALGGRQVVVTNSRGLFLQVAYRLPPPVTRLESRPLDLSQQPTPLHVPIGRTQQGRDLWLPLPELDSVLIAGTRRMGTTNLLHTWIQALHHGSGQALHHGSGQALRHGSGQALHHGSGQALHHGSGQALRHGSAHLPLPSLTKGGKGRLWRRDRIAEAVVGRDQTQEALSLRFVSQRGYAAHRAVQLLHVLHQPL
ncbi:MAG TPA: hypothetical protein G4O04_05800 [Anaerolineae bacterium]|nr:hypothetical protein [Anaerolineae bacterium]